MACCVLCLLPCRLPACPTPLQFVVPQFARGHPLDVHLFLSESRSWRAAAATGPALWVAADVPLAGAGVKREFSYVYRPSQVSGSQAAALGAATVAVAVMGDALPGAFGAAAAAALRALAAGAACTGCQPMCPVQPPALQAVQNNGSVYVHAVFTPTGASPNPQGEPMARPAGRPGRQPHLPPMPVCLSCLPASLLPAPAGF